MRGDPNWNSEASFYMSKSDSSSWATSYQSAYNVDNRNEDTEKFTVAIAHKPIVEINLRNSMPGNTYYTGFPAGYSTRTDLYPQWYVPDLLKAPERKLAMTLTSEKQEASVTGNPVSSSIDQPVEQDQQSNQSQANNKKKTNPRKQTEEKTHSSAYVATNPVLFRETLRGTQTGERYLGRGEQVNKKRTKIKKAVDIAVPIVKAQPTLRHVNVISKVHAYSQAQMQ